MSQRRVVSLLGVLLILVSSLWSQTGTSTVRGTVTDPQARVVAGATVTLTNQATNATRIMKTNEAGAYNFDFIVPGEYRVDVEASGFKKKSVSNVRALVGKLTDNDVQLEVGVASETVEVKASAAAFLVNTQDATLGNNFESSQITQLPLEGRNVSDLLSLQPGSTREGYVAGARADQSNVTLDGVDINNAQTANAQVPLASNNLMVGQFSNQGNNGGGTATDLTTGPVLRLNAEAIDEFRVTTATANANQGRSSGAQVNLVTKSGSNSFHGAAFEFYRSKIFTANDWFNNHAGVAKPQLIRNTFGGALGGPIVKDKVFFFYSYEGRREAKSTPSTVVVPLASLGQGIINYKYCAASDPVSGACTNIQTSSLDATQNGQVYSGVGLNPVAVQALADAAAAFPANDSSQGDGLNTSGFRFNAPQPVHLNSHVAKFDFNLTNRQTAFVRLSNQMDTADSGVFLPGAPSSGVWSHPRGIVAAHTWTIGNWVNNFRYGFTRQAFTNKQDTDQNLTFFRFVFSPLSTLASVSRTTPTHNFTDDISVVKGNHTLQFGTNIRVTRNNRASFATAFDVGVLNPSWYKGGGEIVSDAFQSYLDSNSLPGSGGNLLSTAEVQNAATSLIGRVTQYTVNYTYGRDGQTLPVGSPAVRTFASEEYDGYFQDSWKIRPNFTLTLGLRYGLSRPVYETHGFEVQPNVPLSTFFAQRQAAAAQGHNFTDPIVLNLSGPANNGKPMYNWDKNNFQPRIAFAWSPSADHGFLGHLLGSAGQTSIRSGFAMTNDYYGQALAVDFDLNNTLGFVTAFNINANTYGISASDAAPLFTGYNMDIRSLPNVDPALPLTFPVQQPSDFGERIEQSIDSQLKAPSHYTWTFTWERQMPKGGVFSASYLGRVARNLLARRDVAAFNNIKDPASGMDWYTAGTILEKARQQGTDTSQIAPIPFFENLLPSDFVTLVNNDLGAGFDPTWTNTQAFYAFQSRTPSNPFAFFAGNDWTDTEALVDQVLDFEGRPTLFMHPQYGSLSTWDTVAYSNYHGLALSYRQRLSSLTVDVNYTWSHALDNASGLQSGTAFSSASFIHNPIRPSDYYGHSNFDVRHNISGNAIWQVPFGKGRHWMSNPHPAAEAIFGGWQISGIFRWNTGLPLRGVYDDARWATNWNVQTNVSPIAGKIRECFSRGINGTPKVFGSCNGGDINSVYQSFRNAYPGESGPRNPFRLPGFVDVDLGISKAWKMPWHEGHELALRWEIFNVANHQSFGVVDTSRTGFGLGRDPARRNSIAPDNWSNFIGIQGEPRVMQVGLRYAF